MPRTITIDGVNLKSIRLSRGMRGRLVMHAEYELISGNRVVQTKYEEIVGRLPEARKVAALAVLDAVAGDLAAAELA